MTVYEALIDKVHQFGLANVLASTFSVMGIAENEIEQAQQRYPDKAALLWNSFITLKQPVILMRKAPRLYRSHCTELLDRIAAGEDVKLATDAEIIAAMSDFSLETPLNNVGFNVYAYLFRRVYDGEFDLILGDDVPVEDWPGQTEEEIARLRKKLGDDTRRFPYVPEPKNVEQLRMF